MRPSIDPTDLDQSAFKTIVPWDRPNRDDCFFYSCMDFANGDRIEGANWDIRGRFDQYVGDYPLAGKSLLDVGTASGFLAFSAEAAGAQVTAFDALHAREFQRVPFARSGFTKHRGQWIADTDHYLNGLKRSFWYGWYGNGSSAEVVYAPIADLWRWQRRFDVVVAGAIVEHVSDPVPFLAALAGLAREAVIIAFTPVIETADLVMHTMNDWNDPRLNYGWWRLSSGLYRRVFDNLGFDVRFAEAEALCNEFDPPLMVRHPTLVAQRRG